MRIDYRHYRQPIVLWTALGVVAFALIAVLFGPRINGARRWFGVAGVGVQPSEVAKLAIVFFVAAILERRMDRIDDVKYSLLPIAVVVGLVVTLILLQPDLGTALRILLIVAAMVFAAGINYRYIVGLMLVMLPAAYIILMSADYRRRRMAIFLNPWEDPLGDGFQVIQSLIAVGTGGVFGRGLMAGVQKLFYLPYPETDFIYAVIGEELGLDRRDRRPRMLWRDRVARSAGRHAGARPIRRLPRTRADRDGLDPGVLQHQCRAGSPSDQGHSAAVRQLRWIVAADQHGRDGHPSQRLSARLHVARRDDDARAGDRECMTPLRIVIAGGGTGGHLYPGIAVARELLARRPDAVITFAGTARGIESRVVPREGFQLDLLRSAGLKGASVTALARGLALLPLSALDAWRILSNRKPSLVIGVGGYSSGPVMLAAVASAPRLYCSSRTQFPA